MRYALLDGEKVDAKTLTQKHKKHTFTCVGCGKNLILIVSTTEHYPSHFRHGHHKSCGTDNCYVKKHSPEVCEEFQRLSDFNTLVMSEGNPHSLTFSQRRNLRGAGFLRMMGRSEMELTDEALKILGQYTQPVILPFKCPYCPRTFRNKHGLSIHIGKTHPNIPLFECPYCQRHFTSKRGLTIHLRWRERKQGCFTPDKQVLIGTLTDVEKETCEKLSLRNLLAMCTDEEVKNLIPSQRKRLRRLGFVGRTGKERYRYTPKFYELTEGLK